MSNILYYHDSQKQNLKECTKKRKCWAWWCRPDIPSTKETEAGGLQIQCLLRLQGELKVSPGSLARCCLKITVKDAGDAVQWESACPTFTAP